MYNFSFSQGNDLDFLQKLSDYTTLYCLDESKLLEIINDSETQYKNEALWLISYLNIVEEKGLDIPFVNTKSKDANTFYYLMEGVKNEFIIKDTQQAIIALEASCTQDLKFENKWARIELYCIYQEQNKLDLARKYLEESLKIDPKFNLALVEISNLMDPIQNCKEMKRIYEQIVENGYVTADILNGLAAANINMGNINEGILHFSNSANLSGNTTAYLSLGKIYHYELKNFNSAMSYYNLALQLDSSEPELLNSLAWLYYDIGDDLNAEKYFTKQILKDDVIESYNMYFDYLFLKGEKDRIKDILHTMESKFGVHFYIEFYKLLLKYLGDDLFKVKYDKNFEEIINDTNKLDWVDDQLYHLKHRKERYLKDYPTR